MLPAKISATNLELLLRNPYGFYAKNLLKIRKLEDIFAKNNLSKFGIFIHSIIEEYTNNYSNKIQDKYSQILEIGQQIAEKEYKPTQVKLWWPKLEAIAREFIEFDEERRARKLKIFPEIYGEMRLEIEGRKVIITAIADRIEQSPDGKMYIMDYKTGGVPTKQDVLRGISVQMLIEAMIASEGGFEGLKGQVQELIYVKIASRAPYIAVSSFDMADINLKAHKDGLQKVLSYYALGGEYEVNDNGKFAPKYDDYRHLARKE